MLPWEFCDIFSFNKIKLCIWSIWRYFSALLSIQKGKVYDSINMVS